MKISILLPVFNTEKYLPDCLESILNQTEKNWELWAVDDFSTDESFLILEKYNKKDHRINIIKNIKKGIAPALQLAFQKSTGPLITRMDSDDIMLPEKLFYLKNKLIENGKKNIATGHVEYFSKNGVGEGYRRYAAWLNQLTAAGNNFSEIYKECVVPSPCWMGYRSDLIDCRAFQEEIYPEDYDLVFRWRQAGFKIIPSDKILHQWRDYPDRTSRTDKNYADNSYLQLKLNWFLKSDYQRDRPLVIWGAGKKGKRLARLLNEKNISFGWVTNNQDKIGHEIRGVELRQFNILQKLNNPQIIVAVAASDDQKEIKNYFQKINLQPSSHFFFFC
ncbi:MAG: glycosyltransferase family 2 protein [Bacteroidota bacterium]